MARTLIVVGDALQAGGSVLTGSPQTDIDGHPVARIGDRVICARHGPGSILTGDATLVIDGQPVARHGDKASCGCALLAGKQQLAHVSAGGASVAALNTTRSALASSMRPIASSLTGTDTPPAESARCWLEDHSGQVLEYPDGRYFEAYEADGTRIENDHTCGYRIDVPLKSGGDIVVTAKIRLVKWGRVEENDAETAKQRLRRGIELGINNKFILQITDGACGTRSFPVRYEADFVSTGEDYVMKLHDHYERENVTGTTINVSVATTPWVYVHEFMHCLGLPDEYVDRDEPEQTIKFAMPDGTSGTEIVMARNAEIDADPEATMMSERYSTTLKPRHVWNVGIEVRELLSRKLEREVLCSAVRS